MYVCNLFHRLINEYYPVSILYRIMKNCLFYVRHFYLSLIIQQLIKLQLVITIYKVLILTQLTFFYIILILNSQL